MPQGGVQAALALLTLLAGQAKPHRPHDRVAAGDVTVASGERVKNAISFGGDVTLEAGAQAQNVIAFGGAVALEEGAQVERNVTAFGGDVEIASGAVVGRDVSSWGGKIAVANGGRVAGQIKPHQSGGFSLPNFQEDEQDEDRAAPFRWGWGWIVFAAVTEFVALFVLGGLVVLVFPTPVDVVVGELGRAPIASVAVGLLASLALPFLVLFSIIAIVLLVGLVLLPLEALALAVAWLLGHTALSIWIGRRLRPRAGSLSHLALGTLVLEILSAIPVFGPIARGVAWCLVFGAVLRSRYGARAT